jgi:hypothetical protein
MPDEAIRLAKYRSVPVHRIIRAQANSDFSLSLQFEDGRRATIGLEEVVSAAPVAEPFRDPARFVQALRIVEAGDVLRWGEQFELHADSLRYRAFPDELERDYGRYPAGRGRPAA